LFFFTFLSSFQVLNLLSWRNVSHYLKPVHGSFSEHNKETLPGTKPEEVSQSSAVLSSLLGKNPPLLVQTGTQGTREKSRRNFRVTEEGIRIARNYIKE
jgi:hypothetical protein